MRNVFRAPMCALVGLASMAVGAWASVGPSVRDIVEFTHIVQPRGSDVEAFRRQMSPDGRRVFIVTRKADVATDKTRFEIQLLHLPTGQQVAASFAAPDIVFTLDSDRDPSFVDPAIGNVQWWDNQTLIFLGRIEGEFHQVYRLDLATRQVAQLTHATAPIVSYAVSADMRRLGYAAQVPNPPMKDGARSIVYGNQPFWTVRNGQKKLLSQVHKFGFYVTDVGSGQPPRMLGEPFYRANLALPQVSISPDGRWALLPRYEPERLIEWSRQYPMVDELSKRYGPALRADPLRYYSGSQVHSARRMMAWRLDDGTPHTVVDAPDDARTGYLQFRLDKLWQGTGSSVVLAGTHLPMTAGGTVSPASHVIEYWPDTGRWEVIAKLAGRLGEAAARSDGFEVTDDGKPRRFRRTDSGGWQEVPAAMGALTAQESQSGWTFRVEEGPNQPPDVVAKGPAGESIRLTALNPQFDPGSWGTIRPHAWRDDKGRPWSAGLIEGQGTEGLGNLPLVIQPYFYSPDHFYLDGPNQFGGGTSAFPGRAFVRDGILVLVMGYRPAAGSAPVTDDHDKLALFYDGIRGAISSLVQAGRVDPKRVGIIGWSTTGELTLNAVTFSGLDIRAATLADGDANTISAYMIAYGFSDSVWGHIERMNQGGPFGPTRAAWLRNDPALNTECVNTALRIESYGDVLLPNYDIYALLRRQYKPVEMVLIPGGSHSLSTPGERMISLQGNVDWYRFWLKGESRTEPMLAGETTASLQAQYVAWRQMEGMKAANDAGPRCSGAAR
jgi:dipeptidyl aminopeptidase/acylaminoacyl peptidase